MDKPLNNPEDAPNKPEEPTSSKHTDNSRPTDQTAKANAPTVPGKNPPRFGGAQGAARRMEDEIAKGPRYDHRKAKHIGEGGTAEVSSIEDEWLRREVARKVALKKFQGTPVESRLVLEAYITGILEHSSVVPVHDIGVTRDGPGAPPKVFFTMKKVDGPDLGTIIRLLRTPLAQLSPDEQNMAREVQQRFGSIPARLALFMKVCDAVAFAHDGIKEDGGLHIIHRDLKPANIMVGDFGQVFVMDWGLAKILGESATAKELRSRRASLDAVEGLNGPVDIGATHGFVGTWHYAAPEQVAGRVDEVDRRTDVYALGCLLYHLLTLEMPLHVPSGLDREGTAKAVVDAIHNKETLPRLRSRTVRSAIRHKADHSLIPTKIPRALRQMILQAVDPTPNKRPHSVLELHTAVTAYLASKPNKFEGEGPLHRLYYLARRKAALFAIMALAALAVSGVIWGYTGLLKASEMAAQGNARAKQDALIQADLSKSEAQKQAKYAESALWRMIEHAVPYVLEHAKGEELQIGISRLVPDSALLDTKDETPVSLALKAQRAIVSGRHELHYGSATEATSHFQNAVSWTEKWLESKEQVQLARRTSKLANQELADSFSMLGNEKKYLEYSKANLEASLDGDTKAALEIFKQLAYQQIAEEGRWSAAKQMLELWEAGKGKEALNQVSGIRIRILYLSMLILHREAASVDWGTSILQVTEKAVADFQSAIKNLEELEAKNRSKNIARYLLKGIDDFSTALLAVGETQLAHNCVKDAVQVMVGILRTDPQSLVYAHGVLQAYNLEFDKTFGNPFVHDEKVIRLRQAKKPRLADIADQQQALATWMLDGENEFTVEGVKLNPCEGDRSRKSVTSLLIKSLAHRALASSLWMEDADDAATKEKELKIMSSSLTRAASEFAKLEADDTFNGTSRCWASSDLAAASEVCIKFLPSSDRNEVFRIWAKATKHISDENWKGSLNNHSWGFARLLNYWIVNKGEMQDTAAEAENASQIALPIHISRAKSASSAEEKILAEEHLAHALCLQTQIITNRLESAVKQQEHSAAETRLEWQKLASQLREADSILEKLAPSPWRLSLRCNIRWNWIFYESKWGSQAQQLLRESLTIFRDNPAQFEQIRSLGQSLR